MREGALQRSHPQTAGLLLLAIFLDVSLPLSCSLLTRTSKQFLLPRITAPVEGKRDAWLKVPFLRDGLGRATGEKDPVEPLRAECLVGRLVGVGGARSFRWMNRNRYLLQLRGGGKPQRRGKGEPSELEQSARRHDQAPPGSIDTSAQELAAVRPPPSTLFSRFAFLWKVFCVCRRLRTSRTS